MRSKNGGCVCAFIRNDLKCKVIDYSMFEYDFNPEYLLLEVIVNKCKIAICLIYRAPNARLLSTIEEALSTRLVAYEGTLF